MVANGKNELEGSLCVFQLPIVMMLTIAMMMVVVGRGRWLWRRCEGGREGGEEGGREEEREGGREGRRDGRESSVWVRICVRPNVFPYYVCVI